MVVYEHLESTLPVVYRNWPFLKELRTSTKALFYITIAQPVVKPSLNKWRDKLSFCLHRDLEFY